MKRAAYVVLTAFSLLLGYLWIAAAVLFFFAHRPRWDTDTWRLRAQWRPRFAKRFKFSTTVGAIIYHPSHLEHPEVFERLRQHELVHIRQFDDESIALFFGFGLYGLHLVIQSWWFTAPALLFGFVLSNYVGRSLGAWLRGGHIYRDAEHERSAYAQTDQIRVSMVGKSWLEDHLSRPREF